MVKCCECAYLEETFDVRFKRPPSSGAISPSDVWVTTVFTCKKLSEEIKAQHGLKNYKLDIGNIEEEHDCKYFKVH